MEQIKQSKIKERERGLTASVANVRADWASRDDFKATTAKIKRGLIDHNWAVRRAWASRLDFTPTKNQIECGLSDGNGAVRAMWIQRNDFIPTAAQVDRGLSDDFGLCRLGWSLRLDFDASEDQIECGLLDRDDEIVVCWQNRPGIELSLEGLSRVVSLRRAWGWSPLSPEFEHRMRASAEASALIEQVKCSFQNKHEQVKAKASVL